MRRPRRRDPAPGIRHRTGGRRLGMAAGVRRGDRIRATPAGVLPAHRKAAEAVIRRAAAIVLLAVITAGPKAATKAVDPVVAAERALREAVATIEA